MHLKRQNIGKICTDEYWAYGKLGKIYVDLGATTEAERTNRRHLKLIDRNLKRGW